MAQHIDHIPGSIIYNTGSLPLFVSTEKQSSRSRSKAVVHWHDEIELVHVLEGTMIYIINESYENLKAGDFLFINARQMHWTNQWQRRECLMQDIFTIFRNLFYFYSFEDRIHMRRKTACSFRACFLNIYASFGEKLTLEDIAGSAHICRSKCCRLFRRFAQTSPIDFVNSYRVDQGARMLAETGDKVSLIAQECGFSQQSYFNRLFLKSYGCTPGEYRKRGQKSLQPFSNQADGAAY